MTLSDKFTNTATTLLPHLGGATNITSVVHCITRLRFTVLDRSVVDEAALLTHPAVLGLVDSHTFQVIVGPYAAAPLATAFARLLDQHDPPVQSGQ
ncbi:MAG: PTS glucose/sucrose transporter subunit IIB [Pseudonocardiaceae bacterium]